MCGLESPSGRGERQEPLEAEEEEVVEQEKEKCAGSEYWTLKKVGI